MTRRGLLASILIPLLPRPKVVDLGVVSGSLGPVHGASFINLNDALNIVKGFKFEFYMGQRPCPSPGGMS